jgi:hypothetical protein
MAIERPSDTNRFAERRASHRLSESGYRSHVDRAAEQHLEPGLQARQIHQSPPRFKRYQDVYIAIRTFLSPSDRSKHSDITRANTSRNLENGMSHGHQLIP